MESDSIREVERGAWTIETLREHFNVIIAEIDRRHTAMLMETDHRYEDRYQSSQVALNAAFLAQKEAVSTALVSAEKAVGAALAASEKAVLKAETASDRRFDDMNEFRQSLADQQRTFMPRAEAEAINVAQTVKFSSELAAANDKIISIEKRLNTTEGKSGGIALIASSIGTAVSILVAIAALAFAVASK